MPASPGRGLIDTQVLSAGFRQGLAPSSLPATTIASPTAKELLLAQSLHSSKPLYYVLHPARYGQVAELNAISEFPHFGNQKWARSGHRRTDEIILNLGQKALAYREYGDQAIALLINGKNEPIFRLSISHLPKWRQKYLMDRWRYLVDNDFQCVPLTEPVVKTGLSLLSAFMEQHAPKRSIANTVLDMMIFASAVGDKRTLYTRDKLLARFAAKHYEAPCALDGDTAVVDFSDSTVAARRVALEGKGYINRGWSYAVRKQLAVGGR